MSDADIGYSPSPNYWNSTQCITYTYSGKTYTDYLGNYWSDYAGSDADGDGIGDTPYVIDGESDNYPLMEPFENYEIGPVPGKIAFVSERDGNDEIYVMNADGTLQTRLTSDPGSDDLPAWSPDGARITFASGRDGNIEIYVMNADGSNQTRLTI